MNKIQDINYKGNDVISAQVIVKPAADKNIDDKTLITSENIEKYKPSQQALNKVKESFSSMGFIVGPFVGFSFSLTGSIDIFINIFNVDIVRDDKGGMLTEKANGLQSRFLPLTNLPEQLSELIHSVVFQEPPDFGPSEFI